MAYDFVNGKLLKFNINGNNKIFEFGVFFCCCCSFLSLFRFCYLYDGNNRKSKRSWSTKYQCKWHGSLRTSEWVSELVERRKKKCDALSQFDWLRGMRDMGWYAHKHTHRQQVVYYCYCCCCCCYCCSYILFFSSFFFILFCWLHRNSPVCARVFNDLRFIFFSLL